MEINIKPEDIDKYVKNAILDSTIGKSLTVELEKGIRDLMSGWNSPIKSFMNNQLDEFVKTYMEREDIKPKILEAIASTITPEVVKKIVEYGVHELTRRFNDSH